MEIKIESNIPLPQVLPVKYPIRKMGVGDSFVVPLGLRGGVYTAARSWGDRQTPEWKFITRKINDREFRIWRIE